MEPASSRRLKSGSRRRNVTAGKARGGGNPALQRTHKGCCQAHEMEQAQKAVVTIARWQNGSEAELIQHRLKEICRGD